MIQRIVGCDVGLSGAFCVMTIFEDGKQEIVFEPMPLIGRDLDFSKLAHLFGTLTDTHFFVERVTAFKMGLGSAFKFGRQAGAIEAMLHAHLIVHTYVTPQAWQKVMHEGTSKEHMPEPKQRSLCQARKLFPHVNLLRTERCRFPDSGYVDALLIAEYGRRQIAK